MSTSNKLWPICKLQKLFETDIDLTGYEKSILYVLAKYAHNDTFICYPSVQTIMKESSFSKSTVIRTLKSLSDKKFIYIDKKKGDHNYYLLDILKRYEKLSTTGVSQTLPVDKSEVKVDINSTDWCLTDTTTGVSQTPDLLNLTNKKISISLLKYHNVHSVTINNKIYLSFDKMKKIIQNKIWHITHPKRQKIIEIKKETKECISLEKAKAYLDIIKKQLPQSLKKSSMH